ncbi:MAG: AarF/ABC1/UbiB kinase family protein, partial [Deltaproteobacteria bacterium]|nr:AarF/ABC1/UbiB kinase family protein [Deltaproteobacteria bacterium]
RRLIIAAVERDHRTLLVLAAELGFVRGEESLTERAVFVELCELFAEPLREPGRYDFRASDLAARVRKRSVEAFTEYRFPQPPTQTLFLHRKLAGSFLLCSHIGASVDCHAAYQQWVLDRGSP